MTEFSAQRDADDVHEAVAGWGTDKDKLVDILCSLSKQQMLRVNGADIYLCVDLHSVAVFSAPRPPVGA